VKEKAMSMPEGYRRSRDLNPLPGEEALDELAGLNDLIKPFGFSTSISVAAGATSAIIATRNGRGREGILVAFGFDFESEDYVTSPVSLQTCSRRENDVVDLQGDVVLGPFLTPVGSLTQPFVLPYPIQMKDDKQIALVVTNNTTKAVTALGLVYGVTWSYEQNRDVRRAIFGAAMRSLWPEKMFGGNGASSRNGNGQPSDGHEGARRR
jgi:uncharacterized protein (DUF697 family)